MNVAWEIYGQPHLVNLMFMSKVLYDFMDAIVAGSIGLRDYLEAGTIVFLFTLAEWLESRSSNKVRLAFIHSSKAYFRKGSMYIDSFF